ncbi:DNA methylase [Streptomyces phage Wakanda]|uniref:DNA methylase n=2 Tax=Wakandavirus TaxID=3044854 RepID=A0A6G8R470_9CAUD|nr:DNA methylase [Streptomyces phage Wakanda]YP_010652504.1 DNA methylase [Streptomyces phage Muntaha]QIN94181.1 DNA methylase [Streptomyces phage Wakanda]QIN94748.1 DNA methylase [Streptomyces phage Muntaha]
MTGMVSVRHLMQASVFCDVKETMTKEEFVTRHFDMTDIEFIKYVEVNGIPGCICYDPTEDCVYDGHKRIILAWLLGIETIEYSYGESQFLLDLEI